MQSERANTVTEILRIVFALIFLGIFLLGLITLFTKLAGSNTIETAAHECLGDSLSSEEMNKIISTEIDRFVASKQFQTEVDSIAKIQCKETNDSLLAWEKRYGELLQKLDTANQEIRKLSQSAANTCSSSSSSSTMSDAAFREAVRLEVAAEAERAQADVKTQLQVLEDHTKQNYVDAGTFQRKIDEISASTKSEDQQNLQQLQNYVEQAVSRQIAAEKTKLEHTVTNSNFDLVSPQINEIVGQFLTLHTSDRPLWLAAPDLFQKKNFLADIVPLEHLTTPGIHPEQGCKPSTTLFKKSPRESSPYGPLAALSRTSGPGDCWCPCIKSGANPTLAVNLAQPVLVSHIVIEHISKQLTDSLKSAPKEIAVFGGNSEQDLTKNTIEIAKFEFNPENARSYDDQFQEGAEILVGGSVTKIVKVNVQQPITFLKFELLSNHGEPTHTCVYRLRVYGDPAPTASAS